MKLSKYFFFFTLVISSFNVVSLHSMEKTTIAIEIDLEDAVQRTEEEIQRLAQRIKCKSPEALCKSVQELLTQNPPSLIPYAIRTALKSNEKSILMKDDDHYTALHYACCRGLSACTKALLNAAKGMSNEILKDLLFSTELLGLNALHTACAYPMSDTGCVRLLIDAAKSLGNEILLELLGMKPYGDCTILHLPCGWNWVECAQILLEQAKCAGGDVAVKALLLGQDSDGKIALHYACNLEDQACAELIREKYRELGLEIPEDCR